MTKAEAFAKVKQLMKEAIAKKSMMAGFKYSFVENSLNQLHMDLQLGKVSGDDAEITIQQVENVFAQYGGTPSAPSASKGMTQEEYKAAKSAMYQKYKAGEITNYAYIQWKKKNDPALQGTVGPVSAPAGAKAQTPAAQTAAQSPPKKASAEAEKKYEKLEDAVNNHATAGVIEYDDANKLFEMLTYLKDSGINPEQAQKQLDSALKLMDLNGFSVDEAMSVASGFKSGMKPVMQTSQGMTHDEYIGMWEALNKKKKAGLITPDEYSALGSKLDKAYNDKKTVQDIEKEIGCDPGTLATDESVLKLGKELKKVYGEAEKEIQAELDKFLKKFGPEIHDLEAKFIDGTITEDELKRLKLMTLQKGILNQKADQLTGVMLNANQKAMGMINGEQLNVFAENANWQSYQLTQDTKMNLMFSVYDEHTAAKLLKDKPELLPRKEVNGKKDKAWNRKIISNAVLQGVIQGDSIPKLAKRIAVQTGETNMKAMTRYARTAMTSAQNSGRMEMLHRAKGMGIKCKKVWLATLDSRTRDAHGKMDGQKADVDDDFQSDFGPIKFPGDLSSKGSVPANIYNCRCTLIYDYEGFPNDPTADQRMQYDEWDETVTVKKKDKNGKEYEKEEVIHHREGKLITDMNYGEWKAAKQGSKLNDLNAAKYQLAEAQKAVVLAGVKEDKVYEGLWKDPVTLKDYPAKKAGIQAKRDYYDQEIQKYKDAQAMGSSWATDEKIKDLEKKKKLLNEYEKRGELIEKRDKALKAVQDIYGQVGYQGTAAAPAVAKAKKAAKKTPPAAGGANTGTAAQTGAGLSLSTAGEKKTPFTPDAYSQERKDNALWTTDQRKVDSMMRKRTGEVWRKATAAEKDAIIEYTQSYHKYNEPLRGIEYGTNQFKGVGKADLNAGRTRNGDRLNKLTDILNKCSYDHDMWLQRGCYYGGMDKFLQISEDLVRRGSQKDLENALLGKTVTEYAFMSMGSAKGKGFDCDILFNIYAPAGTKMMYVEPFSHYGYRGGDQNWDGKSGQSGFGGEFETLLQQGTQFRITKVERGPRGFFIDMEVINQDNQQRWKGR